MSSDSADSQLHVFVLRGWSSITSRLCSRAPISARAKFTRLMSASSRSIDRPISSSSLVFQRRAQSQQRVEHAVGFERVAILACEHLVAPTV